MPAPFYSRLFVLLCNWRHLLLMCHSCSFGTLTDFRWVVNLINIFEVLKTCFHTWVKKFNFLSSRRFVVHWKYQLIYRLQNIQLLYLTVCHIGFKELWINSLYERSLENYFLQSSNFDTYCHAYFPHSDWNKSNKLHFRNRQTFRSFHFSHCFFVCHN